MKTPTKIKKNKTTPKVHQELSKGGTFLTDNRSTTLHQRKLKESFNKTNQPVIQRAIDSRQAVQHHKFNQALNLYRTLEAPGLKKKNRFRLNPFRLGYGNSYFVKNSALMRRFQRAPRTILKFSSRKLGRGTLGLTSLFCYKNDGTELNYDEFNTKVRKLMLQKEIQFF
ncbi:MAG: hypothetical protein MI922_08315, partial [Bacteroidales bacterium]|nr:hypothetical protein [Bacteroidales bacterium]